MVMVSVYPAPGCCAGRVTDHAPSTAAFDGDMGCTGVVPPGPPPTRTDTRPDPGGRSNPQTTEPVAAKTMWSEQAPPQRLSPSSGCGAAAAAGKLLEPAVETKMVAAAADAARNDMRAMVCYCGCCRISGDAAARASTSTVETHAVPAAVESLA